MADLTVKQKQIFDNYKKTHPKMSDAEILSALVNLGQIQLSKEQKLSLFNNSTNNDSGMGLKLEHTQKSANPTNQPQETIFLQSGRKIVITKTQDGKDLYKYYAADGTQLNPDYFKQQEGVVRVSANRKTYTVTKNGKTVEKQAKDPLMAKIDRQQAELNKTKKQQGFLGKSWDWFKNKTGIGDGSDKAQKQLDAERKLVQQIQNGKVSKKDFFEATGIEYSKENLQKFKNGEIELKSIEKIKGYQEGQEMAVDMVGDIISGIAAFGIYTAAVAAAPFTGGASIAVGVGAAALSGAAIKVGIKALDATTGNKKYSLKGFGHDSATGAFSGLLAPITAGFGGAVGKTVGTRLGLSVIKSTATSSRTIANTALKRALINPAGYEYLGGTFGKRALAIGAELTVDGTLGGAIDGGFRAGLDNDWDTGAIAQGTLMGGAIGGILSPVIGGSFKGIGHYVGNKALVKAMKEFPDEVNKLAKIKINGQQRFSGDEIVKLCEIYKYNPKRVEQLAKIEVNGKPRFNANDFEKLLNISDSQDELIIKFAQYTNKGKFRFNGEDIAEFIKLYNEELSTLEDFDKLIQFKVDGQYRFSGKDIGALARGWYHDNYKGQVEYLASLKAGDKYRFNGKEIVKIISDCEGYEKEVQQIISYTMKNKPRFNDVYQIRELAVALREYPQETENLLKMNIEGKARFFNKYGENGALIAELAKTYKDFPKEVLSIISLKDGETCRFADPETIGSLAKLKRYNKNLFDKIINEKIDGEYKYSEKDLFKSKISQVGEQKIGQIKNLCDFANMYGSYPETLNRISKIKKSDGTLLFDFTAEENRNNKHLTQLIYKYSDKLNILIDNNDFPVEKLFKNALNDDDISFGSANFLNYAKWVNRTFDSMSMAEKSEFLTDILNYKITKIWYKELQQYFPVVPQSQAEFQNILQKITTSLKPKGGKLPEKTCSIINQNLFELEKAILKNSSDVEHYIKQLKNVLPELKNFGINQENMPNIIKTYQSIVNSTKFQKLSSTDRRVLLLATLLHKDSTSETAFNSFCLAQKIGFSDSECEKVFSILQNINNIGKIANADKTEKCISSQGVFARYSSDADVLIDRIAFNLKEGNSFELAKLLYSTKRFDDLDNVLNIVEKRIKEMKANDFVLPQTNIATYLKYAKKMHIQGYDVMVVHASDIPDWYAFTHSCETAFAGNRTSGINLKSSFKILETLDNINNDRVICTCFVSNQYFNNAPGGVARFIFDVPNSTQHFALGRDINSKAKNIMDMLIDHFKKILSYTELNDSHRPFREHGIKARQMVSTELKRIMNISDDEYIKRLDNIKIKLNGQKMNLENLNDIDPEFAQAYRTFLARDAHGNDGMYNNLMTSEQWNEVDVTRPKIIGILLNKEKDLDSEYVTEYIAYANEHGLPVIVP